MLSRTIKPDVIRKAWDETVREIASMEERIVSPSMVLPRLGSYARQNSVFQTLSEIGRVQKTIHNLKTLGNEEYRRRMERELNRGDTSHDPSRFLCFGREGVLRGREFGDQVQTFSCLSVLHNAVVAWNMLQIEDIVYQLRAEGNKIDDATLSHVTLPIRKRINPFGRCHFDLNRIRQPRGREAKILNGGFRLDVAIPLHRLFSRRYSRNFTKACHIKKLRDPFFIHAGAADDDLLLPASFVLSLQP